MRIVETLVARAEADLVDAQIAFHLAAGVDCVVAADDGTDGAVTELLERARGGTVQRVAIERELSESDAHARMARLAISELGADWVIPSAAHEFWWPRGDSLADVLVGIPKRYRVVHGLVRVFLPASEVDQFFADRMTARTSLLEPGSPVPPLERALRPVYRVSSNGLPGYPEIRDGRGLVPLRGWYPIEVLAFPARSMEQLERRFSEPLEIASPIEEDLLDAHGRGALAERYEQLAGGVRAGLERGELVEDTRLRDALRVLKTSGLQPSANEFVTPDVVDDASYAVECAALGEADLSELTRQVEDLERRIAQLEHGLWPRIVGRVSRLASRARAG